MMGICNPLPRRSATHPHKLGTSGENRTHISRLSGATGYKSAVLPLNYRGMAETVGVEPTNRISTVYGLAIRCITILPNLLTGGSGEI